MNYDEYMRRRVGSEIVRTSEGKKALDRVIVKKKAQLSALKAINATRRAASRVSSYVSGIKGSKVKGKQFIRDPNRVAVVENQPVYEKDKSRYFKTAWEEERRQLFFK